jgi:hypothetical protein
MDDLNDFNFNASQEVDTGFSSPYAGVVFEDETNTSGVRRVNIRHGQYIDGISFEYRNGITSNWHGGQGGELSVFDVDDGDYITEVIVRSGWGTDGLQFKTKNGIVSPHYGGTGGNLRVEGGDISCHLVRVYGRSNDLLNRIDFEFATF